jgi:CRISP-associated protein Cas1
MPPVWGLRKAVNSDWAIRSSMWQSRRPRPIRRAAQQSSHEPLILFGHGVSLQVDAGTLLIRNGLTHHPQQPETYRYFKRDSRIALAHHHARRQRDDNLRRSHLARTTKGAVGSPRLGGGTSSSFPLSRDLPPISSVSPGKQKHEMTLLGEWRFATRSSREKLRAASLRLNIASIAPTPGIRRWTSLIPTSRPWSADRQPTWHPCCFWKQTAPAPYFRAWQKVPIKWRNSSRHPIPSEWRIFGSRSSRLQSDGNRNASHPVNAMLNYAYSVLQSQLQIRAVAEGYDPNIGIMHVEREYGPAFVFDLMEPERPNVDRVIIEFLKSETLHPADFVTRTDGVARLNPQLARHVVSMVARAVGHRA